MRLFIALPIPESVKQQIAELHQPIEGVRWQKQSQIHLTLKFLGNTDEEHARELQRNLDEIEQQAFQLDINGFGYFPEGKQPKVLWSGITPNTLLVDLRNTIEDVCTSLGFEVESRPFKPHITLGRVKEASKREIMSFINQHKHFRIPEIPVTEFVLYESELHSDGAVHSRVNTYRLGKGE
jgi:2'-5' RNA ligase